MTAVKWLFRIFVLGLLGAVTSCAKAPPPLAEVEGIVLLDGQPLPNAYIEFVPDLAYFGAEINSTATTDEAGKFRLTCNWRSKPGAVMAKHWVLVTEVAIPEERRDRDGPAQDPPALLPGTLTNRPIPTEYSAVSTTPLRMDVTKGAKTCVIELTRKS